VTGSRLDFFGQTGSRKRKTSFILHAIAVLRVKDKRFASRAKASSE
jgi:hypothetical protein